MILVVNLNASLDKCYEMEDVAKGTVMRVRSVDNTPGGKGLHVANVATILGMDCIVTGFLGGKTGEFIAEKIEEYGIKSDFVSMAGESRSCLAIITDDSVQTEMLEPGSEVSDAELDAFMQKYEELLESADIVVMSGSVPRRTPEDIYAKLIAMAKQNGKKAFLDTSGALLKAGIEAVPYFIKPNKDEIEALTGRRIHFVKEAAQEARMFMKQGISLVAISLGGEGSVIGYENKIYKAILPKVDVVNPVGSGDSYVAGMAVAIARGDSIETAIKYASACGTANAMEKESGFVKKSVVDMLMENIKIEILE